MEFADLKAIVERLSRYYLAGEVSGRAYAWLAESLIASSGHMQTVPELEEFAEALAFYSPLGEDGLFGDEELKRRVQAMVDGFPA